MQPSHILYFLHRPLSGAGGIERHTVALLIRLTHYYSISVCYPQFGRLFVDTYDRGTIKDLNFHSAPVKRRLSVPMPSRPIDPLADEEYSIALQQLLSLLEVDAAHIQHLMNHSLSALDVIANSHLRPRIVSLRDYYFLCPNYKLLYLNRHYCGVPSDTTDCSRCLYATHGYPLSTLRSWRIKVQHTFQMFDAIHIANPVVLDIFERSYDIRKWNIYRHELGLIGDQRPPSLIPRSRSLEIPLRVAYVGTAQRSKGYEVFCKIAAKMGSDFEFFHFGARHIYPPAHNVQHMGSYQPQHLPSLLQQHGIDVVLLLSQWPETYCHVLTEVIAAGVPVIGSNLGAVGERIFRLNAGWAVEPTSDVEVCELLKRIASDPLLLQDKQASIRECRLPTLAEEMKVKLQMYDSYHRGKNPSADRHQEAFTMKPPPTLSCNSQQHIHQLATDNARLAISLQEANKEIERLRRRLGKTPKVALDEDDVQATTAYRVAFILLRLWSCLPKKFRNKIRSVVE